MATLILCAVPGVTSAEPTATDLASARDFMREGRDLRDKGDHAGALKKFQAAYALVPTPITGLAVAQEQIAVGQLVEARETLGEIGRTPPDSKETEFGKKARADAAALLTSVEARVPVLEIKVTGAPSGQSVTLTIDDKPVPLVAAEQGYRVDPGTHVVVARAGAGPERKVSVTLKEKDRKNVELTFDAAAAPASGVVPTVTDAPKPTVSSSATPNAVPPAAPVTDGSSASSTASVSSMKTVGLIGLGAGGVAMGVGAFIALSAKSSYSDAKDAHCPTGVCDREGKQLTEDERSRGNVATVVFVVGAALAVGGAVLWLTAPSGKTGITSVGIGPGTLSLGGRF